MWKFIVLLVIVLTAIPNTFGEIELPPLALECLEDFRNLYHLGAKIESDCREKYSTGGELNYEGYDGCKQEWQNSDSGVTNFKSKCGSDSSLGSHLSGPQKEVLVKRTFEIIREFQTNS